jgi:hypothetical protein
MLGARVWHPTTFAPEGPARPDWTWRASPGKLSLQANRNPTQAHGTPSKARYCFYPWERRTTERPNSMELARCKVSWEGFSHKRAKPALTRAMHPPTEAGGFLAHVL